MINASAVGEFVYCARAYGLRRVTDGAAAPVAAARAAQGQPATWRPGARLLLAERWQVSDTARRRGTLAHHRHHRAARASQLLARAGLLVMAVALLLGLLTVIRP
jgi:hypothetical protein